jgi:hypothetical protein
VEALELVLGEPCGRSRRRSSSGLLYAFASSVSLSVVAAVSTGMPPVGSSSTHVCGAPVCGVSSSPATGASPGPAGVTSGSGSPNSGRVLGDRLGRHLVGERLELGLWLGHDRVDLVVRPPTRQVPGAQARRSTSIRAARRSGSACRS